MAGEFRLKGITSLDLQEGEKKEVEVEGVENGKVTCAESSYSSQLTSTRSCC